MNISLTQTGHIATEFIKILIKMLKKLTYWLMIFKLKMGKNVWQACDMHLHTSSHYDIMQQGNRTED